MEDFIKFLYEHRKILLNLFMFLILYVVILLVLPSERRFRYEFSKGKPWQHEDLIAPFTFPIYKLPSEIKRERDSIERIVRPYFVYDPSVEGKVLTKFRDDYKKALMDYMKQDSALRAKDYVYRRTTPRPDPRRFDYYYNKILKIFHFLYEKGIFSASDISDMMKNMNPGSLITIYRDGLAKMYTLEEVFTLKKAYMYLKNKLDEMEKEHPRDSYIINFFRNMNLDLYIQSNLRFDRKKTEELKRKALASLSLTMGFVQAGQRIIYRGEVVDTRKYRILESLKRAYEQPGLLVSKNFIIVGNFIIVLMLLMSLVLFVYNYKQDILTCPREAGLIILLMLLIIVVSSYFIKNEQINIYIIPFAIVPVIIKVFFDERMALFVHLVVIFIIGFYAPNSFEFVLLQFVSGYAAIFSLTKLSKRGQLYLSSAGVFLALSLMYFGIALTQEGSLKGIRWVYFAYFGINSLLVLLAYPLIYAFEKIFGFISDMTLIELSNTNNKLLRDLSMRAPGTFVHSLQVANLAEAAANELGANSLLVRVGAMYHDIGKLYSPLFFIENQVSGINPHDNLSFEESARYIIRHVTEGVKMAQKNNLPKQIIDFIRTHHGTTVVQYFYKMYVKKYPDRIEDIEKFRYPGPKPFSKETAIVMMADSIEAASRAMKQVDKDKIDELVDRIISYQMSQKQFEDTDLTFRDIERLRVVFKKMLLNIYHPRIEYPK